MKIRIICVAYHRAIPLRILIDSFLVQTDSRWELNIIHDGKAPQDVKDVIALYNDPRIIYTKTKKVNGLWGHPNRSAMLQSIKASPKDFILMTNDDNYYVPIFVQTFLGQETPRIGLIFCNTVHSYMGYNVLQTRVAENYIDMGSFVVRADVAKKVGFNHKHLSADGRYAIECADYCRAKKLMIVQINRPFFIHN